MESKLQGTSLNDYPEPSDNMEPDKRYPSPGKSQPGETGLPPDGGYGWVVVVASFFSLTIFGGHFTSFGLLYQSVSEYYGVPYGVSGWIGSLSQATTLLLAFVYSSLVQRFGCRTCNIVGSLLVSFGYITSSVTTNVYQLYLTFGLISGVGGGLVFLSNIVIVQRYFIKRRAFAIGLSTSGISTGVVGTSFLIEYFLGKYGWKGTILIVGGVYLHGVVLGYFLRPLNNFKTAKIGSEIHTLKPDDSFPANDGGIRIFAQIRTFFKDVFDFSLLKRPLFHIFCLTTFCSMFGMTSFYMHTPNRALHLGLKPNIIGWLPSMTAIVTFVFRVMVSFVANSTCANRIIIYASGMFFGGVILLVYPLCTSFVTIFFICAATGASIGIYQTVQPTLLIDLVGIEHIAKSQALTSLFMGSGSLLAAPFAGFLFDIMGDYKVPFILCGGIQTSGAVMSYAIYYFHRRTCTKSKINPFLSSAFWRT